MANPAEEIAQVELEPLTKHFMWKPSSMGGFSRYLRHYPLYIEVNDGFYLRADFFTSGSPRIEIADTIQFPISLTGCSFGVVPVGIRPEASELDQSKRDLVNTLCRAGQIDGFGRGGLDGSFYFDLVEGEGGQEYTVGNPEQDFSHLGLSAIRDTDTDQLDLRFRPPLPVFKVLI